VHADFSAVVKKGQLIAQIEPSLFAIVAGYDFGADSPRSLGRVAYQEAQDHAPLGKKRGDMLAEVAGRSGDEDR
jgi:hypothetical protein